MKKLLILATLLLALVLTVVACKGGETPEVTTGPDVDVTEPATDVPTEEPDVPTEEPTVEPDVPTEEPTKEPDVPTEEPSKEPDVPTEEPTKEPETPTEPPVDPDAPLHTVEPDFLANYAAQEGNLVCNSDLGTTEMLTEAGRTFFRLTSAGGDPYIAFIDGQKQLKIGRYMAVSYRTNSAKIGQFFMGSGDGWNGNGDNFLQDWNEDGNWNLAIVDLDNVGLTALTDYVLNYARLDFFTEAGAEGDYFDVEYIAFFNTAEAAQKYDFEAHKAPMWTESDVITHQSFDQLYLGTGTADNSTETNIFFTPGQSATWDMIADLAGVQETVLTYWGWIGFKGELGQFGYQINGGSAVYNAEWTHPTEQPVIDAAVGGGADSGSRFKIAISVAGLEGENSVRVLYKTADGIEVCLNEFVVKVPVLNLQNKFESNVSENADGTDLQASDLSQYFTITYGAGEPHVVSGGMYQYGGINELYAMVDGYYAFSVNMHEAANTAMMFVRGTRVVHSVDLPAVDGNLYPINNYYETDGQGRMGGAGIYAALYNGKLNLMIKAYDDETRTHQINRDYAVKAEGTELTIADNGETIYFLVDGKLLATVALSGSTSYEKICDLAEGVTFAQTAVVTLADGTTDTIENTLVVSTHKSQVGIAVRPATMKFDSIKVLGFNDVIIPEDFYVPEEKVNIALNKPVSADSTENDQNVPYKMTDGDESTRWGAQPNGVANVVVDLEAVYTLSGMDILFENAGWGYEIAISTDGETYEKIYESAGHSGKMVSLEGTVDARYIKFTRTQDDGATHYWFSIYELYVYGTLKDAPIGPEAPEYYDNLTIPQDQWVISGHMPQIVTPDHASHGGMVAAGGVESAALLHQGSIYLGNIDLSKYSKIVIMWGSDASQVTVDAYNANANNRFALVNADKAMVMSPAEDTIIAAATYELHGWAVAPFEIDLTDVNYSGDVYLTHDSLPGGFALVYSVEFIGAEKTGEEPEEPIGPEAPANVVIDLSTIEGHQATNNFGYNCPILTIGYDKVFFVGDIDLDKYAQIIIEYSYDGDTVVEGKPVEQNWAECGRAPIIGFTALNKSFGFANVTHQDAIDSGIYTDLPYTPGTWAAASRTAVIEVPENIGYNGPCYLSAYNPWFREIAVSSITLVPRVVDEPDEPAKGELIHTSNDELRIMGTDNVTQIGQAFEPGKFDGWNKVLTLEEGSFGGLIDWGWAAVKSTAYEFGYIINGAEIFSPLFNGPADPNVDAAIANLGANNGGRFLGMCAAQALIVGENNVKFAVKLDGGVTAIIREYTVIVTPKTVTPPDEPEDPIGPPPPHEDKVVTLANRNEDGPYITDGSMKFGQKYSVGENILKGISITNMATYSDGSVNTWSFKVWKWNTDYATTTAAEPLFVQTGENHQDNQTFTAIIPADLYITGEFYYEIEYLSGSARFTSWCADAVVEGLESYTNGVKTDKNYASSLIVGIPLVEDPNFYPTVVIDLSKFADQLGYKPSFPEAGISVPLFDLQYNGFISIGELDLSQYSAVEITYSFDGSDVTLGNYNNASSHAIGLKSEPSSFGQATDDNFSGAIAYTDMEFAGGWTSYKTAVIDLSNVTYNGAVYVTMHNPAGTSIAITGVKFIGAEKPAPHEHSYEAVVTAPTCTEAGYTTYTCACGDTYTADEVAATGHTFADGKCTVCGAADPDYVAVEMPAEFVLSLYQANLGKTLYFSGAMSGYYFATSENVADAVKIYSEKVEGGYRMYFLDGDTKTYLDIVHRDAGRANVVLTTSPVGIYVWNADANTWTVTIEDTTFYLGTYNSFNTISASKISYITGNNAANVGVSQFVAQWADVPAAHEHSYEAVVTAPTCTEGGYTTYTCACGDTYTADEVAALGHSFADGTCSVCGEKDPNYVAPEYYENYNVPQSQWNVSGHCPQIVGKEGHGNSPMVAAGGVESGALLHQGAIALGDIDLSKYSKVIIYYGVDNSDVTWGHYNANANNRIMLVSADTHLTNSPAEETIIAGAIYEPCGWKVVAFEIDLTGVDYNGPVYVTYDTLPGTFMLFSSVEFIGAEKPAPHQHNYETVVTAPTCTEGGYTTYTCACGDTYTADEVAALGHSFADGVCSVCGAADPDYEAPVVDESSATIVFDSFDCLTDEGDNYKVFANAGLTFTQNQGESTSWNPQYINPVRLYKNHIVTIEFANLNKIVFVVNAAKYVDPLVNSIADDNATVTADGNTVTIEFAAPVDSFTITFTGGQVRVDSITVYAAETSEEEPTAGTSYDDPIELSATEKNTVNVNAADGMGDYNNGKGNGAYVTFIAPANGTLYFNTASTNLDVAEVSVSWNGSLYTEWGTPDSSYSVYAGETYTFLLATMNSKADSFTVEIVFEEAQPELYNETEIFVVGSTIEIWPSAANYKAGAWVAIFAQGAEMTAENAIMSFVLDQDQYSFDASALGVGTYVLALITADGVVSDTVDYTVIAKPVTHVSFDQLYAGSGVAGSEGNIFAPGSYATWDGIANVEGMTEFTAWGWTGLIGEIGQFGYIIDGDTWSAVYNDAFAHATEQPVIDAAMGVPGTTTASRFKIVIPVIAGTHTVDLVYKNADGIEIIFASFTMTSPKAGDSAENPLYVTDAMTVLEMGPNETVYLYFRNPNGMILSTDSYVSILYNGQEYPASYDLTEIIFTEGIGEGALVAVTASEYGAYAYFTLSEYVPPVSELPFTTEISTNGYVPGEITIQAPTTGVLTMVGGDNCSFLVDGAYGFELLGDGTATLEVVEGQTYTIGVSSVDWNPATFTVTFTMGEAPAIGDTEIIEGTINVTTTDNNGWFDQYTFVAEVAGTYTFTIPAGLGFCSKAAYDAYGAPEIDFYENASGYSFSIDLAAGESYVFYVGSTEKTDWVISYSCAVDAEGGETPEVPDVPVEPVEDISGTYYAGDDTVEIDAAMGTLVYTFTTGGGVLTTAEYTFEIVDGAVVLSNANGVIADSMAIYFGKLELNANGVPSVFWYNGYDYALTLA